MSLEIISLWLKLVSTVLYHHTFNRYVNVQCKISINVFFQSFDAEKNVESLMKYIYMYIIYLFVSLRS